MRHIRIAAAAAALLLAGAAQAADIADLDWMTGAWVTEGGGPAAEITEERWAPARGGVMLGTSLSVRHGKASGYEFLRISADDKGEIDYWGSPQGAPPVAFRLVHASEWQAVFVNPGHDYPQRIVYQRTGRGMTATISLADGTNARNWRYKRVSE
jgi:hypothetical protein